MVVVVAVWLWWCGGDSGGVVVVVLVWLLWCGVVVVVVVVGFRAGLG